MLAIALCNALGSFSETKGVSKDVTNDQSPRFPALVGEDLLGSELFGHLLHALAASTVAEDSLHSPRLLLS